MNMMSSERPTLAYVVNSLNPGGTERLVVEMSLAFSSSYQITVVCLDEPGFWAKRLRSSGIPVHCLWRQPGLDLEMPFRLSRFFRRHRAKMVHAHQCTPWFYSALSRLLYSKPRLLLEEHGRLNPEVENRKRILINRVLISGLTHRFVSVSEDVRKRLRKYEGLESRRIDVVYNGVKPEPPLTSDERSGLRHALGINPNEFVVGTVGRFDPIKNLPLLMKSLASVKKQLDSIRGLLVGDGPNFRAMKGLRDSLGLCNTAVMTGYRDDARKCIQCFDVFVLPSFSEGTSMALLEAMASGVPVIVTDVGGNPEVVLKDVTGWVIPSDSVESLTKTILEAVKNRAKRVQYADAGRSRYLRGFTFDKMIESYKRIYCEMLEDSDR